MRLLVVLPALLLLLVLQGACAMPWQNDRPAPASQDRMEETLVLDVDNRNFLDARIYVLRDDGLPERAGIVTGNSQERLRIENQPGNLRIQVDFVAGDTRTSDVIQVWEGETVELLIPSGNQPLMTWTS